MAAEVADPADAPPRSPAAPLRTRRARRSQGGDRMTRALLLLGILTACTDVSEDVAGGVDLGKGDDPYRFDQNLSWMYDASELRAVLEAGQFGGAYLRDLDISDGAGHARFDRFALPDLSAYRRMNIVVRTQGLWQSTPVMCLMSPTWHYCNDSVTGDGENYYRLELDPSHLDAWRALTAVVVTTTANFQDRRWTAIDGPTLYEIAASYTP